MHAGLLTPLKGHTNQTSRHFTWIHSSSGSPCRSIQLRLGEHNIAVNEGTEQFISSSRVIRHQSYNSYNLDNDIMLIKLKTPATLNSYVNTVSLPSGCASAGTSCLISGWGNTSTSGSESKSHIQKKKCKCWCMSCITFNFFPAPSRQLPWPSDVPECPHPEWHRLQELLSWRDHQQHVLCWIPWGRQGLLPGMS